MDSKRMFLHKRFQHWHSRYRSYKFQQYKVHLNKRYFRTNRFYIQHLYYDYIEFDFNNGKITCERIVTNTLTFIEISSIEKKVVIVADAIINATKWIRTVFTTWSTFALGSKIVNQNSDTSNNSLQPDFIPYVIVEYNMLK